MNPYPFQQQPQIQYQQQYGQQPVQFLPYPYAVQPPPAAMMGQYGGTLPAFQPQASMAVGLPTASVAQGQLDQTQSQAMSTATTTFANQGYQYVVQPTIPPPPLSGSTSQAAAATSALVDMNQKYTEEYQKWQQQYNEWQAQHANHPDQKLFQEYQQQVQQYQQQQQQILGAQGVQVAVTPQSQPVATSQVGTGGVKMEPQAAQTLTSNIQTSQQTFTLPSTNTVPQVKQDPFSQSQPYQNIYSNYQATSNSFATPSPMKQEAYQLQQQSQPQQSYSNVYGQGGNNHKLSSQAGQTYRDLYNESQTQQNQGNFSEANQNPPQSQVTKSQPQTYRDLHMKSQGENMQYDGSNVDSTHKSNQTSSQYSYNQQYGGLNVNTNQQTSQNQPQQTFDYSKNQQQNKQSKENQWNQSRSQFDTNFQRSPNNPNQQYNKAGNQFYQDQKFNQEQKLNQWLQPDQNKQFNEGQLNQSKIFGQGPHSNQRLNFNHGPQHNQNKPLEQGQGPQQSNQWQKPNRGPQQNQNKPFGQGHGPQQSNQWQKPNQGLQHNQDKPFGQGQGPQHSNQWQKPNQGPHQNQDKPFGQGQGPQHSNQWQKPNQGLQHNQNRPFGHGHGPQQSNQWQKPNQGPHHNKKKPFGQGQGTQQSNQWQKPNQGPHQNQDKPFDQGQGPQQSNQWQKPIQGPHHNQNKPFGQGQGPQQSNQWQKPNQGSHHNLNKPFGQGQGPQQSNQWQKPNQGPHHNQNKPFDHGQGPQQSNQWQKANQGPQQNQNKPFGHGQGPQQSNQWEKANQGPQHNQNRPFGHGQGPQQSNQWQKPNQEPQYNQNIPFGLGQQSNQWQKPHQEQQTSLESQHQAEQPQHYTQGHKPSQGQTLLANAGPGSQQNEDSKPKQQPNWLKTKINEETSASQINNETSPTKPIPKWLQSQEKQPKQQSEAIPTKPVPKWLQSNDNQTKQTESPPSKPKWLQSGENNPVTSVASSNEETKPLPKWLQETKTVQEQAMAPLQSQESILETKTQAKETKQIPKWLQESRLTMATTAARQSNPMTTAPSSLTTSSTPTSDSESISTSIAGTMTSQKLDAKQQLEILQKQSMQLLQLAELERKQREGKSDQNEQKPQASKAPESQAPEPSPDMNTTTIPALGASHPGLQQENVSQQLPERTETKGGQVKNDSRPPALASLLKTVPCKFFPNCRNGADCKFQHPPCTEGDSCTALDCICDHSESRMSEGNSDGFKDRGPSQNDSQSNEKPWHGEDRWYPESADGYRRWDDEQRWQHREDWDERRPPSPRGRGWDGRERPRDDYEWERHRDWERDCWERPDDYRDDRWGPPARDPPPRDEYDRWERSPDDWGYAVERDRRPPSPRYRREMDYDRDGPYYGGDAGYRRYDRAPPPDDRWYDRDYDGPPRDPEWRERRGSPERYQEADYRYPERWGPPKAPPRDYDGDRYWNSGPEGDRWEGRGQDYRDWDREHRPHPYKEYPREMPPVEKKVAVVVPVENVLNKPGRDTRPDRIVIILRGLPGSGKTHVARLIKDKEVSSGAHAPRIIGLDDYFLTEVEKKEKDPETGKLIKKKVTEYVYEEEMEEAYMASMFKVFTKTLEDGFFPVIMVDAINNKIKHFEKYWSHAKQKGFEVYIAELSADAHVCAKRNSHQRSIEDISQMLNEWEESPAHMMRLDVRALLQDAVITEVEMETADETSEPQPSEDKKLETGEPSEEDDDLPESGLQIHLPQKSKWDDMDSSAAEAQLNKLDGIRPMKRRRPSSPTPSLSDDDDPYDEKEEDMRIGKKRVRWADLEERKHMEHRRRIGFCIGTDWSILTDPHAKIPEH